MYGIVGYIGPCSSHKPLEVVVEGLAHLKSYDVDKPRNLAKSVTVE